MMRSVQIRAAGENDWLAIVDVLEYCGLPNDVVNQATRAFHIATLGENVIGCACAEQYGETVVVRSVGVLQEYRGHQIATRLIGSILTCARADGCTKAVLITAGRLGLLNHCDFSLAELKSMPEEVRLSRSFVRRFGVRRTLKISTD
ncbi:N-acetyltransferase GCN5 [Cupriavidus basilensis OR16]|uniref:N-acetyltransferase GCN5 n=1 Tax=Cupriavidus basilensis OR16 TaxID=1127483 RepID=H1RZT0_9BURK|nr:GNAT family N-acetyltransferase [Cupriavidus basilensis]EHP44146.1 N-acetyltransferase GCN5 [Cupriavidus basilensis OR16]